MATKRKRHHWRRLVLLLLLLLLWPRRQFAPRCGRQDSVCNGTCKHTGPYRRTRSVDTGRAHLLHRQCYWYSCCCC
uniref:Putative secreted protein n=1 Tax=Anopheles darlingi TaxID=43151 RepID=A0A2M4DR25_ANODA